MKKFLILCILGSMSQKSLAGGYHFDVAVESYEEVDPKLGKYITVLVPTSKDPMWPEEQCEKIKIAGEFDKSRWGKVKSDDFISQERHNESISFLSNSIGSQIVFGVMGLGLKEIEKCSFLSNALISNINLRYIASFY